MLHRGASLYTAARNDDLLKVKPHEDAEARVVGHQAGRGKDHGQDKRQGGPQAQAD